MPDGGSKADLRLLGVGIYSIPEAARLSKVPPDYIRRWLWGYRYTFAGRRFEKPPLWDPELPTIGNARAVSFRDLIEVQFVHRFRQEGLSLQSIRTTIGKATELLAESYPLSSVKFKTDGKHILAEVLEDPSERSYIFDLHTNQYLLQFVLDYLYDALEYTNFDQLIRWWPLGKNRRVVVDPRKSFGRPVVVENVPTAILAGSFKAEGSVAAVAHWFEVAEESVVDALEFERSRAA